MTDLRKLAEAATKGPWQISVAGDDHDQLVTDGKWAVANCAHHLGAPADAAYIAAVSPDVVLGLLDRISKYEITTSKAVDECVQLIAERDRLREALAQAADWFKQYGDGHAAKGDADKATRNYTREAFCRAALAGEEQDVSLAPITMAELMAAERRGYLRGLEDAAKVADEYNAGAHAATDMITRVFPSQTPITKYIANGIRALAKEPTI